MGEVGAGKSSLLASIFGEMIKFHGNINVNGSISYVGQQAWLQNTTLKNNILFGKQCYNEYYQQIVSACALEADINLLPGKDLTEIGEKVIIKSMII